MKKLIGILVVLVMVGTLFGCTGNNQQVDAEKKEIKIANVETTQVPLDVAKEEMAKDGYTLELNLFDANVNAIKAVNDGSLDAAMAVHIAFMEKFNAENNGDLVMVEPYAYYTGIGLFSEKYDSIEKLPDGARIAIMNDAMNMDRGLRMMRDANLVELDENVTATYSLLDITKNPKNFEFIDMDQIQTVRALGDLDGAIVFFSHMRNADKDYRSYLIRDKDAENYPVGIVVKAENADTKWAKDLANGLRTDAVRKAVDEYFDGMYEFYKY